jgi:hypothetical protein
MAHRARTLRLALSLLACVGVAGRKQEASSAPASPIPEVAVITVATQTVPDEPEFIGQKAQLIKAQFDLDNTRITAPIAGLIERTRVYEGRLVSAQTDLLTVIHQVDPRYVTVVVQIEADYPGASAEVVADAVARPIEVQLPGIDNLLYYDSTSTNDGHMTLRLTFEIGTDIDIAAVQTQNREKLAEPQLPPEVVRWGITVRKVSPDLLAVLTLESSDPRHDALFLANYAILRVLDNIKRLSGVGDALVFGAQSYSMRLILDPVRMAQLALTPTDIANVVNDQNRDFPAGTVGREPAPQGTELPLPVITRGRMTEVVHRARRGRCDGVGGNMAAVVSLMAKDRGTPKIKYQVLLWPVTDANFENASYDEFAEGHFLTRNMMKWFWDNYTTDPKQRQDVYASPLQATTERLKGLPPTLIQTAEKDVLRDEGEAYGRKQIDLSASCEVPWFRVDRDRAR